MRRPIDSRNLLRLQILVTGILGISLAVVFARELLFAGDIAFIFRDTTRPWIAAPIAYSTAVYRTPREKLRGRRFRTEITTRRVEREARLFVRALRDAQLIIDGKDIDLVGRDSERWKKPHAVEVGDRFSAGRDHVVEVVVTNPGGPPLLQVWSEGVDPPLVSSPDWRIGGATSRRQAQLAEDRAVYSGGPALPSPLVELARRAPWLLVCFVLGGLLSWRRAEWLDRLSPAQRLGIAWSVVAGIWSTLFVVKGLSLPRAVGFDGDGHIEYIEFLANRLEIPLITDGWLMHHPPLFYAGAAAIRGLLGAEPGSTLELAALRILPWLSGLGSILAAQMLIRRLAPDRAHWPSLVVLSAGLLPVSLYVSTFVSNESMSAFWIAVVLWLTAAALAEQRVSRRLVAALGVASGLALLSKSSGAIVIVVAFAFLGFRYWAVDARSWVRSLAPLAGATVVAMAIGGWFYLRNLFVYGDPVTFNFDLQGDFGMWQSPGFRTAAWYASFGDAFTAPFFSGMNSLWDGLYTSFWGDAYGAGRAGVEFPNPFWNYRWMAAIYPLAVPATLAIALGFGWLTAGALNNDPVRLRITRSFVLAATGALFTSLLWMTLRYPYYGLAKASYLLGAAAPAAVAWAIGLAVLDEWLEARGWHLAAAALWGVHACLAMAILGAFLTW